MLIARFFTLCAIGSLALAAAMLPAALGVF